jgi:hypothetical protein
MTPLRKQVEVHETVRRVIHWRCPRCRRVTSEELPVSPRTMIAPPAEETIDLTCASCERERRARILGRRL